MSKNKQAYYQGGGEDNKIKTRVLLLHRLIKLANDINSLDFATDSQIGSGSIIGDSGTVSDSVPIGGETDEYLTENDLDGKGPDKLKFGRDYDDEASEPDDKIKNIEELVKIYDENSKDVPLYGLPDGIDQEEELTQPNNLNSEYGITDSGNTTYNAGYR